MTVGYEGCRPEGVWQVRYCTWIDGEIIKDVDPKDVLSRKTWSEQCHRIERAGFRSNLVLNSGRDYCAGNLTRDFHRWINAIQLGQGVKSLNLPSLNDGGVAAPIVQAGGAVGGIFTLDQAAEVFRPIRARRFPTDPTIEWGAEGLVSIDGSGVTTLSISTLLGVDFTTLGMKITDQVVFNTPTLSPVTLQVKKIVDSFTMELHNPYGFVSASVQFRIETPGGQLLISKVVRGSDFPVALYGPSTLVTESCLLFNDGVPFNRVIYAPGFDDRGYLIQPADVYGTELGATFEALVTF